jgi:hypothetical protein
MFKTTIVIMSEEDPNLEDTNAGDLYNFFYGVSDGQEDAEIVSVKTKEIESK